MVANCDWRSVIEVDGYLLTFLVVLAFDAFTISNRILWKNAKDHLEARSMITLSSRSFLVFWVRRNWTWSNWSTVFNLLALCSLKEDSSFHDKLFAPFLRRQWYQGAVERKSSTKRDLAGQANFANNSVLLRRKTNYGRLPFGTPTTTLREVAKFGPNSLLLVRLLVLHFLAYALQ